MLLFTPLLKKEERVKSDKVIKKIFIDYKNSKLKAIEERCRIILQTAYFEYIFVQGSPGCMATLLEYYILSVFLFRVLPAVWLPCWNTREQWCPVR